MTDLRQHGRYDYSPVSRRADFDWPEGRRVAIYLGVNYEVFSFGDGLGATLAPSQTEPDVMNYAWRDYGNRVGAWRFMELFDRLELKTTALINGDIMVACPGLAEACRDRGDEIAAHGMTNASAQGDLPEAEERAMIERTLVSFARIGLRPRGWLGPWISESDLTPDLLDEAGFDYLLDWAHDDQPVRLATRSGRGILSVALFAGDQRHPRDRCATTGSVDLCGDDRGYAGPVARRGGTATLGARHRAPPLCHGSGTSCARSRSGPHASARSGRSPHLVDDRRRDRGPCRARQEDRVRPD